MDPAIAALAQRQHGVVARRQLDAMGLGRRAIGHRIDRGRLHPVHRGVYAVGHRVLSLRGAWLAAVLAIGPDAVLSHRSAAALWGIRPAAGGRVDITAPRSLRSRRGILTHHAELPSTARTAHDAIPVTSPHRTLRDLAPLLEPHQLERAVNEAERLQLTDGDHDGITLTRSDLEARFLSFLDVRSIPRPATNVPVDASGKTFEADCVYTDQRLVVELDGYAFHATRAAFERDRARDRRLQAAGWRVIRITWRQLEDEPGRLAAELRALLGVRAPAGPAAAPPAPSR